MLRSHRPLILNWFRARSVVALGAVEGLNNKLKVITRRAFGFKSFKPHVEAAYDIGITPRIVRNERIGLDVDTPEDLIRVIERIGPSKTRTYLESSGIASRLGHPHNSSTPARSTS